MSRFAAVTAAVSLTVLATVAGFTAEPAAAQTATTSAVADQLMSCEAVSAELAALDPAAAEKARKAQQKRKLFGFAQSAMSFAPMLAGGMGGGGGMGGLMAQQAIGAAQQQAAMQAQQQMMTGAQAQVVAAQQAMLTGYSYAPAGSAAVTPEQRLEQLRALSAQKGCAA